MAKELDKILQLKETNYAKSTGYALNSVKNTFNNYLLLKNIDLETVMAKELDKILQH